MLLLFYAVEVYKM